MNVHPKVLSSAVAGAIVTILAWILTLFNVVLPPETASAIALIIMFIAGYVTPSSP